MVLCFVDLSSQWLLLFTGFKINLVYLLFQCLHIKLGIYWPIVLVKYQMNDNYFENLSDVELRHELRKYGIPIVPIVETTRNLLIKKLKCHILSNDMDSRRTLQSSVPSTYSDSHRRRRTHSFFSHSRSDTHAIDDKQEHKPIYLSNEGLIVSYKNYEKNMYEKAVGKNINTPTNVKSSPKISLPPPVVVNNNGRSSKQLEPPGNRGIERRHRGESCGVVSRLLKLRDSSIRGRPSTSPFVSRNNLYSSDSDSDGISPSRYSTLNRTRNSKTFRELIWNRLCIQDKLKQSSVPYLLICCLGLFFMILSILYMIKPADISSTIMERSTTFASCEEQNPQSSLLRPSIDCINNQLMSASLTLCKELIKLLQSSTEAHYCVNRDISAEVSASDFVKYIYKTRNNAHKLLKSFHAAMYLVEQNPQWKIQILNKPKHSELIDIYKQDVSFVLSKPYLPLKCVLYTKLQRFLFIIGIIFLVAFILTLLFVIWRLINKRKETNLKIVENLCEEICKELMEKSGNKNDTGEVIINHLRDKLLPLNKKKSLLSAWNQAICKLEANDSRILFSTTLRNGEEFRTMKWSEATHANTSSCSLNESCDNRIQKKYWQSPAFDNVNKILDPPTNCLKIRHMFDVAEASNPNLKQSVIESILEKVGPECHIYDIQLDNCCVYIRCAKEKDAGIIHNEVNGWWFDNRLVSIKFLRLQRFLDRFPNSTGTTTLTKKNVNKYL